ncbi:MAG: dihydroorotate dehydrogenase-like protein [Ilumatobacter sp.]|nr:dihydroorotate dehydrogenase-like protein [Ilumatobacter sp.]
MTDLRTNYLGLSLRSPIVASAGPHTGDLDLLLELERAGAAAIVLPSLFEEQVEGDVAAVDRALDEQLATGNGGAAGVPLVDEYNAGADDYLALVEAAKASVDIPVIASLNGTNIGYWLRYARLLESAGADAVELNLYSVAADPIVSSVTLESEHTGLVAVLTDDISIPVAVKISPFYSSIASFVVALQAAGAAGVVMFNRFYMPDFDLDTRAVVPRISLSTPEDLRLPLRWIAIMREHLAMSIGASSGVHSGFDVAKAVLAGADVAMATSALLRNGVGHVATMEEQLRDWMKEQQITSVDEMRGTMRRPVAADPAAFERANYIGNLAAYSLRTS